MDGRGLTVIVLLAALAVAGWFAGRQATTATTAEGSRGASSTTIEPARPASAAAGSAGQWTGPGAQHLSDRPDASAASRFQGPAALALSARDTDALQAVIDQHGLVNPDVIMMALAAMAMCERQRPAFTRDGEGSDDALEPARQRGRRTSADRFEGFLERYCRRPLDVPEAALASWSRALRDDLFYHRDPELAQVRDRIRERASDRPWSGQESEVLALDLAERIARADSFLLLDELLQLAVEASVLDAILGPHGYEGLAHRAVVKSGGTLAGCRIFGGCGSEHLFAVHRCLEGCSHPMGLDEYVGSGLAPLDLAQAEQVAVAILRLRLAWTGGS